MSFINLRIGAFMMLIALTMAVVSCGNNNSPTSTNSNPTSTPTSTPTPNVSAIANFGASSQPWNLHFDASGNLYVALFNTSGPCTVGKIASPGTAPVTSIAYAGTAAVFLQGAVADSSGNLWLVNNGAQVIEIPHGGGTPVTITTGFASTAQSYDEVINSAGTTLYIGDYNAGYVYALNLSSPLAGVVTIVNNTGTVANPAYFDQGLAFDSSGDLFLGGFSSRVGEITSANLTSGAVPVTFAGNGTYNSVNGTATGTAEFSVVYGVAVDSSGNVYATDYSSHGIREISGGQVTTLAAPTGSSLSPAYTVSSIGASDYIYGVACDSSGNVYFADYTNGNIYRYQRL